MIPSEEAYIMIQCQSLGTLLLWMRHYIAFLSYPYLAVK